MAADMDEWPRESVRERAPRVEVVPRLSALRSPSPATSSTAEVDGRLSCAAVNAGKTFLRGDLRPVVLARLVSIMCRYVCPNVPLWKWK